MRSNTHNFIQLGNLSTYTEDCGTLVVDIMDDAAKREMQDGRMSISSPDEYQTENIRMYDY